MGLGSFDEKLEEGNVELYLDQGVVDTLKFAGFKVVDPPDEYWDNSRVRYVLEKELFVCFCEGKGHKLLLVVLDNLASQFTLESMEGDENPALVGYVAKIKFETGLINS